VVLARDAINASDKSIYATGLLAMKTALKTGKPISGSAGEAFKGELSDLLELRKATLFKDTSYRRIADLSGAEAFATMQYMPTVLKKISV